MSTINLSNFKEYLIEGNEEIIKDQIISILDDLSDEEIEEFGEFLYDEFYDLEETDEESEEFEGITKDEVIGILNDLDPSTYEYILDMLQFDDIEESEVDEAVARVMKATNVNRKKRKFFAKGAATLRKEKVQRKRKNRETRASRKRYYRQNKQKISAYQASRGQKIAKGIHHVKLRKKGL